MAENRYKVVLPIVVMVGAVAVAAGLVASRKAPQRTERVAQGPLVDVLTAAVGDVPMTVAGQGEVVAKVVVDVVPQVGGRVVDVHRALVAGGFFAAGEALVVIDPRDYELVVERAQAAVARARVGLERELAEAEVARQEWQALHPGEDPASGLVVREPQVRQAEAELEAAVADLDVARLNLERTRISLPFAGVVVSKSVDVGQYVAPGRAVARVYGTDRVEVRVPLEDRELAWFDMPRAGSDDGPTAWVSASFAGGLFRWRGRVVRMEAEVDPGSRMVHVVVEVPRPYVVRDDRPPLLPGTFVAVEIDGRTLPGAIAVPRHAVHEGDTVWVARDGMLEIRNVEIARADRETAYVTAGISSGEPIIVTPLDAVTDGMKVRIPDAGEDEDEPETVANSGLRIPDCGFPPAHPGRGEAGSQSAIRNPQSPGPGVPA